MENVRSILLGNRDIQERKRCIRAKDVNACKTYIKVLDAGTIDETILATLTYKSKQSGNNSHIQLGDKMEKASKKATLSKEQKEAIKKQKEEKAAKWRKAYKLSHSTLVNKFCKLEEERNELLKTHMSTLITNVGEGYNNSMLKMRAKNLEKLTLEAEQKVVELEEKLKELQAKNKGLNNTLYGIKREAESILLSTLDKALSPAVTSSHTSKIYKLINNIMGLEAKKECEESGEVGSITYYPPQMPDSPQSQTAKWGQCPSGLKGSNEI